MTQTIQWRQLQIAIVNCQNLRNITFISQKTNGNASSAETLQTRQEKTARCLGKKDEERLKGRVKEWECAHEHISLFHSPVTSQNGARRLAWLPASGGILSHTAISSAATPLFRWCNAKINGILRLFLNHEGGCLIRFAEKQEEEEERTTLVHTTAALLQSC